MSRWRVRPHAERSSLWGRWEVRRYRLEAWGTPTYKGRLRRRDFREKGIIQVKQVLREGDMWTSGERGDGKRENVLWI